MFVPNCNSQHQGEQEHGLSLPISSLINCRLSAACQKKCIPPKYPEADLNKGEAICLDRCVAKFLEVHDRIGKKLTQMYMQDEAMMKKVQGR